MRKVSIIGCGAIGTELALALEKEFRGQAELVCLCDIKEDKAASLAARLSSEVAVVNLEGATKEGDLVIECASGEVVPEVIRNCLKYSKDAMIISIGGLIGQEELLGEVEASSIKLYLPSGALFGVDLVKAAGESKITSVELITRKPPAGLEGAPYLKENNIDIANIDAETEIFSGTAREAIAGFPKNVNVSSLLSLAGLGVDNTRVRIISSPRYTSNSHQLILEGDFGVFEARTDNLPSPKNPRTSYLAILSCLATLRSIFSNIKIGT